MTQDISPTTAPLRHTRDARGVHTLTLDAPTRYPVRMRDNARLSAALSAITAAVVGVVLNLAVWFGLHVLFPSGQRPDVIAIAACLAAFAAMQRLKVDIIPIVAAGAVFGLLSQLWR